MGWLGVGLAIAQGEPRAFVAGADSRPLSDTTSSTPLRWRTRPRPSDAGYAEAVSDTDYAGADRQAGRALPATILRAGWNVTRIDPSVRPVQAVSASPFSDPFGDRQVEGTLRVPYSLDGTRSVPTTSDREPLILQPTNAEAGVEELPAPRTLPPTRRTPRPGSVLTAQQPGAADRGPPPGGSLMLPPAGARPSERGAEPCDRIYSDRNCCDLEANCHAFRDRLLSDSIRNISLDITAPYDKNPDQTPEQNEADRVDKFRLLEQRVWRDRRGNVVATGKLDNIQSNAIVLVDEAGRETKRVKINELGEDELCYVTAWWRLPSECPLGGIRRNERQWLASTFHWHASALCHKPLYFQDVQLERYGHTAGPLRQPLFSGAHFIVSLASLPYQMAINPPGECQYALGYYRPGSCAPWMIEPIPLSLRGAAAEIGVALGLAYVIP